MANDVIYMQRAIQLGKNGLGTTAPNPMVGCVIVCDGKIIGEGFTSPPEGPHAEVNAISSVRDKNLLKEATLYVTLEPCSHFGKTPPCADLIIRRRIPKVVIGIQDPYTKVAGRGIQKLKDAGCEVHTGVLEKECRKHHKRFLTFYEKKRPYIILKWAETLDGFMAPEALKRSVGAGPYWITDKTSRQLVHKWRSEEQAILVGTNTVFEDNPRLDLRSWEGTPPLRLILDRELRIQGEFHVLDGSIPTVILTEVRDTKRYLDHLDYVYVDFKANLEKQIAQVAYDRKITSIFIEGGSQTLDTFIKANFWDEARVFTGISEFGKGLKAPNVDGRIVEKKKLGRDILKIIEHD